MNNQKIHKFYVVKSLRMTNYLAKLGFDIKNVEDNAYDRRYKIFLFEDSHELRRAMDNFK